MIKNKDSNWLTKIYSKKDKLKLNEHMILVDFVKNRENIVYFDVGANIGGTIKPFLEKKSQIYAFEPDPDNLKELYENAKGFNNVKISNKAVSNQNNKSVTFYNSSESRGISSLKNFTKGHKILCTVDTVTLSSFIQEENINHIDYLKIDTEGYDLMVLKGHCWDKIKPDFILVEFEDFKTLQLGYNSYEMADFLVAKGYHVYISEWYPIEKYGGNHKWKGLKAYPCHIAPKSWGNMLAFKEEPSLEELLKSIPKKNSKRNIYQHKFKLLQRYIINF